MQDVRRNLSLRALVDGAPGRCSPAGGRIDETQRLIRLARVPLSRGVHAIGLQYCNAPPQGKIARGVQSLIVAAAAFQAPAFRARRHGRRREHGSRDDALERDRQLPRLYRFVRRSLESDAERRSLAARDRQRLCERVAHRRSVGRRRRARVLAAALLRVRDRRFVGFGGSLSGGHRSDAARAARSAGARRGAFGIGHTA